MNRRNFITSASLASCLPILSSSGLASERENGRFFIKPIVGSWFQFEHHNQLGSKHWNHFLPKFTTEQWRQLVFDMHEIGMEYLALLSVAYDGKTYYPSKLWPRHDFACEDPLETVLAAADECGAKFFVSNDYWSDWKRVGEGMTLEDVWSLREKGMTEIAEKYAHHKSFYGWYYPHETEVKKQVFDDIAIEYTNRCSKIVRSLTPNALTMIAPYGTRYVKYDERFIRQLEQLDVSIIAYQDEVGVYKTSVGEAGRYFEDLYKMHTKAGRARLWADIEVFDFEKETYRSPAIPAQFERVLKQIIDVTPYVEQILMFQYQGMMNKPGTIALAGLQEGTEKLYSNYADWLKTR
ncbi:MAG: DUF4434 domain-containing protein [Planctomycetaceae bacterium]|nr:DUF4434 domain-containing protein [Planctomycetaceae bacterium]